MLVVQKLVLSPDDDDDDDDLHEWFKSLTGAHSLTYTRIILPNVVIARYVNIILGYSKNTPLHTQIVFFLLWKVHGISYSCSILNDSCCMMTPLMQAIVSASV